MKKKVRLKKRYRLFIRSIFLIVCFFIVSISAYMIYNHFSNGENQETNEISKGEKTNSVESPKQAVIDDTKNENIDIVAIGNSDLYSGWNPLQLWNEQGITSFVAAGPKQNTKLSYYMLKEVLEVAKPQLIVLEVDGLFGEYEDIEKNSYKYTAMEHCYKLFENKSQWNEIKDEPYMKSEYLKNRMKLYGYYYSDEVKECTNGFSYMKKTNQRSSVSSYTKAYLNKIINLAKDNNCQIMFMCFPSQSSWSYARHNTVNDYAIQYNIPFVDFNVNQYNTGFDWLTDSRDGGNHLNYSGAKKMTSFLSQYFRDNYKFVDHRNDSNYDSWNESYNNFIEEFVKH